MKIKEGKEERALRVVVYGPEGVGKSTFASNFPKPLYLDLERGTSQLDVRRYGLDITSWEELNNIIDEIQEDMSVCRTLVIDTADAAESLCLAHVLENNNKKGIEDFGYGKGYTYLAEAFSKFLEKLDKLNEKGMHIVILSHSQQRKVERPDERGAYDHYELKLQKKTAPLVKEWCDMLLFMNYKIEVQKTENNTYKASGGKRIIYTTHTPYCDAKNRFGLEDELDLDYKYFKPFIIDEAPDISEFADLTLLEDDVPFTVGEDELEDPDFKPYPIEETVKKLKELTGKANLEEKDVIRAMIQGGIEPDGDTENPGLADFNQTDLEEKVISKWDNFKSYAWKLKEDTNEQRTFGMG